MNCLQPRQKEHCYPQYRPFVLSLHWQFNNVLLSSKGQVDYIEACGVSDLQLRDKRGSKEQEVFLLVWQNTLVQQPCQTNGINEATVSLKFVAYRPIALRVNLKVKCRENIPCQISHFGMQSRPSPFFVIIRTEGLPTCARGKEKVTVVRKLQNFGITTTSCKGMTHFSTYNGHQLLIAPA